MLLVGSAGSRRTALLRAAAAKIGAHVSVIDWREVLDEARCDSLLQRALRDGHAWCKFDPPSDDAETFDALVRWGCESAGVDVKSIHTPRHGELAHLHWWYGGLLAAATRVAHRLGSLRLFNSIEHIAVMCDKVRCQSRLQHAGVAIPAFLGEVASFDEFEAAHRATEHPAVFVKLRFGSSAAGVVALRRHRDGRMRAYSSARLHPSGAIFNHLRISEYTDRATIATLIDALARQGAYAERWVPKPRAPTGDACYDLRVVAFRGRARQCIARLSRSPLTNLHLGNRRAAPAWLRACETQAINHTIESAVAALDAPAMVGFDIGLHRQRAHVFEANAFGDLLPELRFDGMTTYDDQARQAYDDER